MPTYNFPRHSTRLMLDEFEEFGNDSQHFKEFNVERIARSLQRNGDVVVDVRYRITAGRLVAADAEEPMAATDIRNDETKEPGVSPGRP